MKNKSLRKLYIGFIVANTETPPVAGDFAEALKPYPLVVLQKMYTDLGGGKKKESNDTPRPR